MFSWSIEKYWLGFVIFGNEINSWETVDRKIFGNVIRYSVIFNKTDVFRLKLILN